MNIGQILSNVPPIVENIFKYLNKSELDYCAEVCELWKRVAETEKNCREDIAWFFQGLPCSLHNKVHSSCEECSNDLTGDIESSLTMQLKDLRMKPMYCLTFASNYFMDEFEHVFPSFQYPTSSQAKRIKQDLTHSRPFLNAIIHTALGQHLPDSCKTTFCVATGVVGSYKDTTPLEIEEGCGISGVLIPHVPGLQIITFSVDEKQCDISKQIPQDVNVKCLLVFVQVGESMWFHKIVQDCLLKEKSQIAVGGAIIDRSTTLRGSAVAFCGRSVEAASVIIGPKDREVKIEKKLKLLQKTGLLKHRCFAFMFACVGRGHYIYRDYNVESKIFHELYPDVPLLGMFGSGEIGIDHMPNTKFKSPHEVMHFGKLVKCRKRYLHTYSTIFVLVSVKL